MRDLNQHLAHLEETALVQRSADPAEIAYLFRHALIQDAAHGSLLRSDQRRLHRLVGQTLEGLYPDRVPALAAILAHHFALAGDEGRAVEYQLQAGDQALSSGAPGEATQFFQAVAAYARREDDPALLNHALEGLGTAASFLGETAQALACYEEALSLTTAPRRRGILLTRLGVIHHTHLTQDDKALIFYQRAEADLTSIPPTLDLARLLAQLGDFYVARDTAQAIAYLRRAVALLDGLESQGDRASIEALLALALAHTDPPAAVAVAEGVLDWCRRFGMVRERAGAYYALALAHYFLGAWDLALGYMEAVKEDDPFLLRVASSGFRGFWLLKFYLANGRLAEAIQVGEAARAAFLKVGNQMAFDAVPPYLQVAYEQTGRPAEAAALHAANQPQARFGGVYAFNLACAYNLAGHPARALGVLQAAAPDLPANVRSWLPTTPDMAALRPDPAFQQLLSDLATLLPAT